MPVNDTIQPRFGELMCGNFPREWDNFIDRLRTHWISVS